jgi:putative tricarboxylic transport membrane protein
MRWKGQAAVYLGICLFSVFLLSQALSLGAGALHEPGPGLWPALLAVGLAVTAAMGTVVSLSARNRPDPASPSVSARKSDIIFAILSLLGFAVALRWLGFALASLLLILLWLRVLGNYRWWVAVLGGVLATVVTMVVFQVALGLQLPAGTWF